MTCIECKGMCGKHAPDCQWARDIARRYFVVLNALLTYGSIGDVVALRDAYTRMPELIAWAEAHGASRAE